MVSELNCKIANKILKLKINCIKNKSNYNNILELSMIILKGHHRLGWCFRNNLGVSLGEKKL